jgi:hypothetical protein
MIFNILGVKQTVNRSTKIVFMFRNKLLEFFSPDFILFLFSGWLEARLRQREKSEEFRLSNNKEQSSFLNLFILKMYFSLLSSSVFETFQ